MTWQAGGPAEIDRAQGAGAGRPGARIDRRTLLKLGGLGTLAAAGCSGSHRPPRALRRGTATSATPVTASPPTSVARPDWGALADELAGHLVLPGDAGYGQARQLFDPRYDVVHPAGIAYCATVSDVQRSLAFARRYHLPLAARSGGHSYGGYSTSSGLVIDVTTLSTVSVTGGTATIGAGARLIDVYTALNRHGVSIPAGSCPTVGIAGLTLGGGIGVVGRLYGMTCDRLTALQVVTADGQVVNADSGTASDLFWASRGGGGGNFGIVTSFTYRTFATTDVAIFTLRWPWGAAADVLAAWLRWAPAAPDPLWSNCLLSADPQAGQPQLQVSGVWAGGQSGVSPLIDQLVAESGAPPTQRFLETTSFDHAMYVEAGCASLSEDACHRPGQTPGGTLPRDPSLAKSDYLDSPLSPAGLHAVLAGIDERQAAGGAGGVGYDAYGGAINRVAPDDTAFVHRNALCSAQYSVPLVAGQPPSVIAGGQAWLDQWYASLRPYVSGYSYQNYIDPGLSGWAHAYYGSNLARLQQVKRAWDPDDIFRFSQSIPL